MKFLKVEWTKKRGVIALLATGLVVTSFILGGYVATGNWNPWGNRHYYQMLNANFQECHTIGGVQSCSSSHNVLFNTGARYVEQLVTSNNEGFCTVSATCSFNFIAMSTSTTAPLATQSSTGVNGATSSGDCGNAGGTGGQNGGAELTTNGFTAIAGTVTDIPAGGATGSTSTVVKTFTDTTAATTVAQSCLVNQVANNSATRVNLAAQTFTAITLQVNDQITITWTLTWSWS